jgi:hypothetical protein
MREAQRQQASRHKVLRALGVFCALGLLMGCREEDRKGVKTSRWEIMSGTLLEEWQEAEITGSGGIAKDPEGITLKAGAPMTGVTFPAWEKLALPLSGYRVTYEAMRVEGADFFGSLTFPVGSLQSHLTLVLGGWGGSLVGLSNLDGLDASENGTGSSHRFENGQWYRVLLEVRAESLQVWIDDKRVILQSLQGKQLSLRHGDIDRCLPFGFATFGSTGKIRNVTVEGEIPPGR